MPRSLPTHEVHNEKPNLAVLMALLLAAAAPAAFAQQQQPILSVNMTEIDVLSSISPPTIMTIYGANPIYGTGGPMPVNGGSGPYRTRSTCGPWPPAHSPRAASRTPSSSTAHSSERGQRPAGRARRSVSAGGRLDSRRSRASITSPASAADGLGHTATSLPVEYFATGISIVSPVPNSVVPLGSSVVMEAASAIPSGAISSVEFYADGAAIGSAVNYPYSIIYTPPGPIGQVHFLSATSYDADGARWRSRPPSPASSSSPR